MRLSLRPHTAGGKDNFGSIKIGELNMSETKTKLFDILRDIKDGAVAIAPGLKNIGHDVVKEAERFIEHGATEGASLLNTGSAFVLYGPGQQRPNREQEEHSQEHSDDHSQDQSHEMHLERDGHER
jgi:hypothetical protein